MPQRTQIKQIIELGVAQANVNAIDLNSAVAALAQENARARVATGTVTDLTDSSGGTDNGSLSAVVTPTIAVVDGVALMAPKAAVDTQIGLIEDAHEELGVKASEIIQLIASGSRSVSNITAAAAADNIIAAIAVALTGTTANNAAIDAATGITQIVQARNVASTICAAVNWVRVAQGLAPIADNSGGNGWVDSKTAWGPLPDAAATGAVAGTGANSLTETSVEAALTALRDNIATMAAALTEANAPAIGPFVVATNNPRTRFSAGDVTP